MSRFERFLRDFPATILLVFLLFFFTVTVTVTLTQWRECSEQGGEFVRGVVWYSCVGDGR